MADSAQAFVRTSTVERAIRLHARSSLSTYLAITRAAPLLGSDRFFFANSH